MKKLGNLDFKTVKMSTTSPNYGRKPKPLHSPMIHTGGSDVLRVFSLASTRVFVESTWNGASATWEEDLATFSPIPST